MFVFELQSIINHKSLNVKMILKLDRIQPHRILKRQIN
jgi:hypothetical protein